MLKLILLVKFKSTSQKARLGANEEVANTEEAISFPDINHAECGLYCEVYQTCSVELFCFLDDHCF